MSRARCFPVWLLLAAGFEWCAASRHGPGSSTGLQAVASDFSPSSWKRSLLQTSRDGMSSCTCIEDLQDRENLSEIVQEIAEDTRIVGGTEVSPPFR